MDFANAAWPELGTTKDNKHFQLPTDVQILLEPERDRVQRSAQERGAARQEVGQAQVREDRVHRQGRSGEKAGLCTIKLFSLVFFCSNCAFLACFAQSCTAKHFN